MRSLIFFLSIVVHLIPNSITAQCRIIFLDPISGTGVPMILKLTDSVYQSSGDFPLQIDSVTRTQLGNSTIELKFPMTEYTTIFKNILCKDVNCHQQIRFDTLTMYDLCLSDTNLFYLMNRYIPYDDPDIAVQNTNPDPSQNIFCSYSSESFDYKASNIRDVQLGSQIYEVYRSIRNTHGILRNVNLDLKIGSQMNSPAICFPGDQGQTVLLDSAYCMSLFRDKQQFEDGLIILLGHELQHAIKGDLLEWNDRQTNPTFKILLELEADWLSGYLAEKMGIDRGGLHDLLDKLITNESPTRSHPSKAARINMVLSGWLDAYGEQNIKNKRRNSIWVKSYGIKETYIGEVNRKGFRNGLGVYHYQDDDWYVGQWNNSLREGFGLAAYKEDLLNTRAVTEGIYVNDYFVKGIWFESSGIRRIGYFEPYQKNDEKGYYQSGFGMISHYDKSDSINHYYGFVSENKRDSLGLNYTKSSAGTKLTFGIWRDGEFKEQVPIDSIRLHPAYSKMLITHSDGSLYFGEIKGNRPMGFGALISNSQLLFGEWEDGFYERSYYQTTYK